LKNKLKLGTGKILPGSHPLLHPKFLKNLSFKHTNHKSGSAKKTRKGGGKITNGKTFPLLSALLVRIWGTPYSFGQKCGLALNLKYLKKKSAQN
jgi:hypothetical protein